MAKLSARGRTAIVEVTRERTRDQIESIQGAESLTIWQRTTRRLMSDGTILEKYDVVFRPDRFNPNGSRHSYGWRVYGRLKTGVTPEDFSRIYAGPTKSGKPSPWTVRTINIGRTVVLSPARIARAVGSGEYIGFCTECGSSQSGVEPDAHGYKCESCGAMAVTGAEDLLMTMGGK